MWKAGRERTQVDPFLDRVVLDACRRFKALDAVPDLEMSGRQRTPVAGEVPNPLAPPAGVSSARCR